MSITALTGRTAVSSYSTDESRGVDIPAWETAFVCVALFLSTNALLPLLFNPNSGSSNSVTAAHDPISHKAWLLVVLFVAVGLVRFGQDIVASALSNPALMSICYLALASTFWSAVPGVTLKYSLELAFSTLLGLYVGVRFGIARLVAMLSWTTAAILVLSVLFALALPRYGLDHERGDAWRGVFTVKNELGRIAVIGLVVWFIRTLAGETSRIRGAAMVLAFAIVGIESGSRTALGVSALMVGVFLFVWLLSREDQRFVPVKGLIVSALTLFGFLLVANVKLLLAVVGSDYSLTGRAGIWSAVWKAIQVHPWLGYGFNAFWRGAHGPSLAVWRAAGTATPHSHNGFLDLGALGLVLFALTFLVVWRRALAHLHGTHGSARVFPLVYLSFLLLYNLTESSLVGSRALDWIVFAAVAAAVAPATSSQRIPRRAGATGPRVLAVADEP